MSAMAPQFMGFAEEFRAPDHPVIEPERFAAALHLRLQELAKLPEADISIWVSHSLLGPG